MIQLTLRFNLPQDMDWAAMRELLRQRVEQYQQSVPGLAYVGFVMNPKTAEYGGNLFFSDRTAAEAYLSSEIYAGAVARLGAPSVLAMDETAT